ncbi:glutamine-hydrolyzing GMP synthase [Candidatus Micrarchaeota archaeon]|nr:glutamine-hydrolyzing GMP synthase [Candidatus Micrarchaeota archaeon]
MIIVLNFGSQFAHLIARRVRELGRYSQIVPFGMSASEIKKLNPRGIILSGGPGSVYEKDAQLPDPEIFKLGIPVLGICWGQQVMGHLLGGKVEPGKVREYGKEIIQVVDASGIFEGLDEKEQVWFSHGDAVTKLPPGFHVTASTPNCKNAAMADEKRKFYCIQFHTEVGHTLKGMHILENFVNKICRSEKDWSMKDLKPALIAEMRAATANGKGVLMAVSGGVDSMVTAVIMHKANPDNLYLVYVDNGLMRNGETEEINKLFQKMGFKHFEIIDAKADFLDKLKGVNDPEEKRRIIGHTFIEVFEKKALSLKKKSDIQFLAQGTIYPDRIESAQPSKAASKIKSHHNVTLPEKMHLKIIEPLKELYKDEVRELGEELGIPKERVWRHPFPGPGLAIRILGEVTEDRLRVLREADEIFITELKKEGQYDKIWQAFAALLPVKAVGVMGDSRTYENIISLRAVTSKDAMTADWAKIPYDTLERISTKIINNVRGANRVLYDISQKPPATIEYE